MNIITTIPISKGLSKESLSYFTSKNIEVGSIVSIPLRKKTVYGLVIKNEDAEKMKMEIKSLPYNIKKVESIESVDFISQDFIKGAQKISDYYAGSTGSVLYSLIPNIILEESKNLSQGVSKKPEGIFFETVLLQSGEEERYATYKSLIREEFAKGRSVFFCLPTIEDILKTKNSLEKGIEKYSFVLHSGLSKKEVVSVWKKILEETHPVLIIATGTFLSIPRKDIGTIVLEKESSRSYKMQTRPFVDTRVAFEILAKEMSVRLILGDVLLRVETLWEEKSGKYNELSPLKFRSISSAESELDILKSSQDMKKKEFSLLGQKLKDIIKKNIENNENTFLFCGRKGLFPITACSDCGTVVVCKNCGAPVVLYRSGNKGGLFVCNHCGERRDAGELCAYCKGWRLNPYGIGLERAVEEIKSAFPKANIFIMDKDHIKNHKQAVKVREAFYSTPGSIIVGTEMALTYLNEKVENCAVVSIDSYFSIPDFQISEKIFHILLEMRNLAKKIFLIQTRQHENSVGMKIFDYAIKGNLVDFFRDEIEGRKEIGFPPFSTHIKISIEGEKNKAKKEMEEVAFFLKPFEVSVFDAFTPGSKNKHIVHGLISIPKEEWVNKNLLDKLRMIQPHCSVKIDPASLL